MAAFLETFALPIGPAAIDPPLQVLSVGGARARLGFPSPAEDFADDELDLNQLLVRNGPATYLYRADGWSMRDVGICDGDYLIVDRSIQPVDGDLVIAIWDGCQPTCKILKLYEHHIELHGAHPDHPPIVLEPGTEVEIYAVYSVARQIQRRRGRVRAR